MIKLVIQKELRAILLSPKFVATFAVCSLLLLLSVFIGIMEYRQSVDQYNTAVSLAQQRMEQQSSWHSLTEKVYREPNPMSIFVSGLNYDIGRWSAVSTESSVKMKHSPYSDDPIFAVFRITDFVFIIQIVLSLFAILFTYDAINGERENGTLRLVFSNAIPRAQYILGKAIGSWLGLVLPVCIPILLSLLIVQLFGVPLTGSDWLRLLLLIALSLQYITLFVMIGVLISALTRRSSISFLFSLVLWVAFVLIIPRAGVMAAGSIVDVPSLAEIEGVRDGYAKDLWAQYYDASEKRWTETERQNLESMTPEEEEEAEMAMWARMKAEDSARRVVQLEIEEYERKIMNDWQNKKQVQRRLGFTVSRFSPASALQLGAMTLAGNDTEMKSRYEASIDEFRTKFNEYTEQKQAESGQFGGIMIEMDSEKGVTIGTSHDDAGLDITDKPQFEHPKTNDSKVAQAVVLDFGLLSTLCLLSFAAAFVSFLRYDVR
ncbi:MAG: ABC transporter permease subunit [bacterium]|nr:ABC transporter permease subunit [bacterium]